MKPKIQSEQKKPSNRRCLRRSVRPLVVDGFEFDTPLDAALHIIWLLQRLSEYKKECEGQPCDGFRFRQGIIAGRKLLEKLKYECPAMKRPNVPAHTRRADEKGKSNAE